MKNLWFCSFLIFHTILINDVSNKIVLNGIQFELIQYLTKRAMDIQDNVYLTPADNRDDLARRIVAVCEKYQTRSFIKRRNGRQWKVLNVP
jgi:hypothetical protein